MKIYFLNDVIINKTKFILYQASRWP